MGVKGDNVLLAGVNEGTESPKKVAKAAKRTFAAGLDLLSRRQSKPPAKSKASEAMLCGGRRNAAPTVHIRIKLSVRL